MDNLRFILVVTIGLIIWELDKYWEIEYGPHAITAVQQQADQVDADPVDKFADLSGVSGGDLDADVVTDGQGLIDDERDLSPADKERQKVVVTTDVLRLEIDSSGTIVVLDMLDYPVKKDEPDIPLKLFEQRKENWFIAQSGLRARTGEAPNHHSTYQFDRDTYELQAGEEALRVPFKWTNGEGVEVVKAFVLRRGDYRILLEQEVRNNSSTAWVGGQYEQLQRSEAHSGDDSTFIRTYTGGVIYSEEGKYEKIDFDDMRDDDLSRDVVGGWTAMIQHYFLAAWIPPNEKNHFYTISLPENRFVIGSYSAPVRVNPGSSHLFESVLYAGPKIQSIMEQTAEGLDLTVDYGVLTFLGKPIFWLLENFQGYVINWGYAIMMVTLVIKGIFFPLSASSYRSMAKMRKLQPKLQAVKERYEDDKPRFNQEMMAMYKKEKVNPLGGCLPILVQIPVFISLYWVLMETVELRHAPFAFWIQDLSVKDPYYVLPLLMGFSMWIQQRLNPTPVDPVQAKIMKMFPIIFTVFFLFFPAGLVLYWVCNNTLAITQQSYITRKIERGEE